MRANINASSLFIYLWASGGLAASQELFIYPTERIYITFNERNDTRAEAGIYIPYFLYNIQYIIGFNNVLVGLGGLGVTCTPRDLRFAGSNPAEIDGSFSGRKNPEHKSSGRDFKLG